MVEPLLMSAEYGRLEMVKLSVRVFRLSPIAAIRQGDRWLSLRADLESHQSSIFIVIGCLPVALPPTKSKPVLSVQLLLPHLQLIPVNTCRMLPTYIPSLHLCRSTGLIFSDLD